MESRGPKISVIIPVLNNVQNILRAINSVRIQIYINKKVIVIDGGSTDGTVDILKSNSHCIDYWVSEPDGSVYNAFNKGLNHAVGDWVLFLGSDDYLWDENVLSKMAAYLATAYPQHLVVYGRVAKVFPDGNINKITGAPWPELSGDLATMSIGHQGVFHHKDLFDLVGEYNEDFYIAGDYELLLRYLKKQVPFYVPDIVVAGWEIGGISTNPKNKLKLVFERRYAMELNNLTPTWMSRVERILYKVYVNNFIVPSVIMSSLYFVIAKTIIDLDRKWRRY